jgi:hypothetical protein
MLRGDMVDADPPLAARTDTGPELRTAEAPAATDADVAHSLEELTERMVARFERTDRLELIGAIVLSLATILAAWSAYQATRWNGEASDSATEASALRVQATQATNVYTAQANIDLETFIGWLELHSTQGSSAADALRDRFRDEFKPIFEDWLAQAPAGELPPGTPFEAASYTLASGAEVQTLSNQADAAADRARRADHIGDDFVLMTVIMASVLFFAGLGTKFRDHRLRVAMLGIATMLLVGGAIATFSLPQDVGF